MAKIAFIQNLFPVLNSKQAAGLTGFSKQVYDNFFEVLVEESGYEVWCAPNLEDFQAASLAQPDLVVCSPFAEVGNLAPGFAELGRIQTAFPAIPLVVWTNRAESSLQQTLLNDYKVVAVFTGNLLEAPDYFADLILDLT